MANNLRVNPLPGRNLIAPFVRVKVGDDIFTVGDGYLQAAEVTLAEGENASSCRFTIYDPGRKFTDKYFAHIYEIGGLTPLSPPKQSGTVGAGGNVSLSGELPSGLPRPDRVQRALEFYLSQGFTNKGAAAIVGNMIQESSMDAGAEANDQGVGYAASNGLIQWTFERKEGMPPDFEGQLQFALVEMERDAGGSGLRQVLSDPNATDAQVRSAVERWIRWEHEGSRWTYAEQLEAYLDGQKPTPTKTEQASKAAAQSAVNAANPPKEEPPKSASNAGSQITIEMGYAGEPIAAYSFLHTSLEYSMFDPDRLTFGGQAATWVLTQRRRNTAYQNVSLRQIAEKICGAYGLTLEMEGDGPSYEYFPQRGQTDYEALLIEARRIGYRMYCKGSILYLKPRKAEFEGFYLEYGDNLGLSFKVRHQAQSDSQGGARSADPGKASTTGQRKIEMEPETGQQEVARAENPVGAGSAAETSTTGSDVSVNKPKTKKTTDAQDATRKDNESRVKGIVAEFEMPTTPEALLLDPDTPFATKGISPFLDRFWVVDTVTHRYDVSSGFRTNGTCYSPMKNKFPAKAPAAGATGPVPPLNPGGFIKPTGGVLTSGFRTANRPSHQGIDIAAAEGDPVWASADGVVIDVQDGCVIGDTGCGGGYGNLVFIQHDGGYVTRYAHLSNGSVKVAIGDQVKQGQIIGGQSDTGHSFGVHLHFEIRLNGEPQDPLSFFSA